jgi:superfamily I DNA/RNA helicase
MSDTWWVDEDELLEEQLKVLGEDIYKDILLTGPPGSGKTNLLLLRANHMVLASPDVEFYIVCFTGLLQNFIRTGANLYSFPANRIVTQRKLLEQVLGDHDFLPNRRKGESYIERDTALKSAMERLMATGRGRHTYPVLFIDEAQDYSAKDFEIFQYLAINLSCAADLRQGIYDVGEAGAPWLYQHSWGASIALQFHYRVAPTILEVADKVMAGKFDHQAMLSTHQYTGDPGNVEVLGGIGVEDQLREVTSRLIRQLEIYPGQVIGVLVPHRANVQEVADRLAEMPALSGQVTNALFNDFDPSRPIWVSTVHSAKGLEFRCVHVITADLVADFKKHERRVVFMAITRAKTALTIYHEHPLHPFFASAVARPNFQAVSIKNLFGKK